MHIVSPFAITLFWTIVAVSAAGHAQAPSEDTTRSGRVQQSGASSTVPNDAVFRRAEQLVREGHGEAGRALVDSVVAVTQPGSMQYGQALYWRASLAADAAEAERGYRRVILEFPATSSAGNALLNLAQLEMVRGDQDQALVHLHRFEREYTGHESRARASLWLARLYFDRKNERRGCASLVAARLAASPDDVELRNQIEYHAQRCIGVDTAIAAVPPPVAGATVEVRSPAPASTADSSRPIAPSPDIAVRVQAGTGGYTIQVAAYDTRQAAEALIAKLKLRGYTARLATSARPFRVRIGHYDTRADAAAAQQRLKVKGIEGFVTVTERP